jgi:hypothetical protein
VTNFAGAMGTSKSLMLTQAALHWLSRGVKVAIYEMEKQHAFWGKRALAILAGRVDYFAPEYSTFAPDEIRAASKTHSEALERYMRALTCAPDDGISWEGLLKWIEQQGAAGSRIIIADPVSIMNPLTLKPWELAQRFMLKAEALAGKYNCSIILATHLRKFDSQRAAGRPDGDSVQGGKGWTDFADTSLILEAMPDTAIQVYNEDNEICCKMANRVITIAKARCGRGTHTRIALAFDPRTLSTEPRGMIVPEAELSQEQKPKKQRSW